MDYRTAQGSGLIFSLNNNTPFGSIESITSYNKYASSEHNSASIRVADFHIDKDRLFAEINLNPEEMELYNKICEKVEMKSIAPDLVIYLQASVDALLQRIYHRDISHEAFIDKHYLESLNEAFAQHYNNYDEAPLLIVNTTSIDPINNDADYLQLLEQIEQTTSGRHFYNPITEVAFG